MGWRTRINLSILRPRAMLAHGAVVGFSLKADAPPHRGELTKWANSGLLPYSFDDAIGAGKEIVRNRKLERFGSFEIYEKLRLLQLPNW